MIRLHSTILYTFLSCFFAVLPCPGNEASTEPAVQEEVSEPPPPNRGLRDWPENPKVYLIPVRQTIFHPQLYLLRRGVQQAREANADAIILLMNTPGGSVDIMREMVNPIIDIDIPTYTLVEDQAISAGAIIAMATDYIYMTPRATIGDAMPVIMGQGGYAELGEAEREKIESYMDAIVRSIAQAKGRDEMLIRAMVRREIEYILEDGTVISEEGQLLTLTSMEAALILPGGTPLLSEGTVEDLDNMLNRIGLGDAERIELIPSMADDLALLITKVAPLLMMLAMVLFYTEIQTPGIGWAGGTGLLLFVIVVFGHNVAGLAGMEDLVFIAIGMILILVEIVILPGFGIAGLSGMALMIIGLARAMTFRYPGNPGELPGLVNVENVGPAITNISLAIIGSAVCMGFLMKSMQDKGVLSRKLVLADALGDSSKDTALTSMKRLLSQSGTALTPLTPSGTVRIADTEYDAVSDGGYIDQGSSVTVVEIRNHRLIVTDYKESRA
ncbi:MAG: NfeD family protein [Kiritimatiellia bacterium]